MVTVQALTITNCLVAGTGDLGFGGRIYTEGGLTLDGVSVEGNTAYTGAGIVQQVGTTTLRGGSRVTGNTAMSGGGGLFALAGTLTLLAGTAVTDAARCPGTP